MERDLTKMPQLLRFLKRRSTSANIFPVLSAGGVTGFGVLKVLPLLLLFTVSVGEAADYYVHPDIGSGDYQTIGDALADVAVVSGDRILVHPNTQPYYETAQLDFLGRDIVLQSVAGPEQTIIDCQFNGGVRAFHFNNGETNNARIEGFTIRNCDNRYGGAMSIAYASPHISNMIFEGNKGEYGGAIYIANSTSTIIENSIFKNNEATWGGGDTGGALYLHNFSGQISGNLFIGNSAGNYGGAISVTNNVTVLTLTGNNFMHNRAVMGGGAIDNNLTSGTLAVVDSLFRNNNGMERGGGIYNRAAATTVMQIDGSVFENNFAEYGGAISTGLDSVSVEPVIEIYRSQFIRNKAGSDGGALCFGAVLNFYAENSSFIENSALSGGAVYIFSTQAGTQLEATFNFCTIVGNQAEAFGGGLNLFTYGIPHTLNIYNTILWGNNCDNATGGDQVIFTAESFNLKHSIVQGGRDAFGVGILFFVPWPSQATVENLVQVIDQDPEFVFNDYPELKLGSPAINSGFDTVGEGFALPTTDLAGIERVRPLDPGPGTDAYPDIGAYEYPYDVSVAASPALIDFIYRDSDESPPDIQFLSIYNNGTAPVSLKFELSESWLSIEPGDFTGDQLPDEQRQYKVVVLPAHIPTQFGTYSTFLTIKSSTGAVLQSVRVQLRVARTLLVGEGGEFTTIQGAINHASDGDIVLVDAGTYLESIDFLGKAIVVRSLSGPAVTILDGEGWRSTGLHFHLGEGSDSVIEGFTFQNFTNSAIIVDGFCSPTIVGSHFISNSSNNGGAGIRIWGNNTRIANSLFDSNVASGIAQGGGILIFGQFNTIEDCVFKSNKAKFGGAVSISGILAFNNSIIRSTFITNSAGYQNRVNLPPRPDDPAFISPLDPGFVTGEPGDGGALHIDQGGNTLIHSSTFYDNFAYNSGGAISNWGANTRLVNTLLYANWAIRYYGGGIRDSAGAEIISSTIADNHTGGSGSSTHGAGVESHAET